MRTKAACCPWRYWGARIRRSRHRYRLGAAGGRALAKEPRYEDVSRPVAEAAACACTSEGPDGYLDLALKFSNQEIARALAAGAASVRGETRAMTLTGALRDGTAFLAEDCVTFVGNPDKKPDAPGRKPQLRAVSPNPFNPVARASYYLPEDRHVRLAVYDVSGRLIAVLADGAQSAGRARSGMERARSRERRLLLPPGDRRLSIDAEDGIGAVGADSFPSFEGPDCEDASGFHARLHQPVMTGVGSRHASIRAVPRSSRLAR